MRKMIFPLAVVAFALVPHPAAAQSLMDLLPACAQTGSCASLNDILQVFASVAQFLLGLTGSVMMGMFVWGGFDWVMSRGEPSIISRGKGRMVAAVMGMAVTFSGLAVVRTVQEVLQINQTNIGQQGLIDKQLQCSTDSECGTGQTCQNNECVNAPLAPGSACTTALECEAIGQGYTCIPQENGGGRCGTMCEAVDGTCSSACGVGKEPIEGINMCPQGQVCCPR